MDRRAYVRAGALVGLGGLSALAGCSAAEAQTPAAPSATAEPTLASEPDYGDWFRGVSNHDATVDRRGRSTVTVAVGAPANMGAFGFDPAAVAVSPGATVVWTWTGKGGAHNVVAEDGSFDSGPLVDVPGHTFGHRFDDPGITHYVCAPHRAMGMRGAVVVLEGPAPG